MTKGTLITLIFLIIFIYYLFGYIANWISINIDSDACRRIRSFCSIFIWFFEADHVAQQIMDCILKLSFPLTKLMEVEIILDLLNLTRATLRSNCFLIIQAFKILNEHHPMIFYSSKCSLILNRQRKLDLNLVLALICIGTLLRIQIFCQNCNKFPL